jgi:hypothetical protein
MLRLRGAFFLYNFAAVGLSLILYRPWPYIDSLADQEHEDMIDARKPPKIGSCGHDNCQDCTHWIYYPQSHFGNWTIKPVRKCGIEGVVKNYDLVYSTIYTADILENGVFGGSGEFQVTPENKREYWRNTLMREVSDKSRHDCPIMSN